MTATTTSDGFCTHCTNFAVGLVGSKPTCKGCGADWISRSKYWHDLDTWEAIHKKKIDQVKAEREQAEISYVGSGSLGKDLEVLVAQVKADTLIEISQTILNIMDKRDQTEHERFNRIAVLLGESVGQAAMDLSSKKKEAEGGE